LYAPKSGFSRDLMQTPLSETEEIHRAAFNRAFEEAGLGWAWDQSIYRKLLDVTGGKESIRYFITDFAAPRTPVIPEEALP
jgi:hypothetical protein